MTWRVTYDAPSDRRKRTTDATSSGVPKRRIGIAFKASSAKIPSVISVSITPGATQLTVMPRRASSTARAFAAPMSPALAAE